MLSICLDSSYQTLEDQQNKMVAVNTVELLSCDEDALAGFLFVQDTLAHNHNSEEIQEKISDQTDNVVTEAELLFNDDTQTQTEWKKQPDVFDRFEIIKLTLKILKTPSKNQTCLGYINKIYSAIIRREASQFLQFLSLHPEYIEMMIDGLQYYAIGNLLTIILSSEDKSGLYKFQQMKKQIFQQLLDKCFQNINSIEAFEGILTVVEEILNITKQTYYEYFEDFKRCANVLVCEDTLKKFLSYASNTKGNCFVNAFSYLQLILKRINTENDDSQNDYYRNEDTGPTMKFQHQFIFKEMNALIKVTSKIVTSSHMPTTKIIYFSFLYQLMKNTQYKSLADDVLNHFKSFAEFLFQEKSKGMVKNYLYQIVQLSFSKIPQPQVSQCIEWFYKQSSELIKNQLKNLNPNKKIRQINSNETNCYVSKIVHLFKQKYAHLIDVLEEEDMNKVKSIAGRYQIKLAKEEERVQRNILNDQFKLELPFESLRKKKQAEQTEERNITIPALILPNNHKEEEEKNHETVENGDKIVRIEEEEVRPINFQELSRQEVILNLKNTKIELPSKFRNKQEKEQKLPINKEQYLIMEEVPSAQPKVEEEQISQIIFKTEEIQFFIKHLILL